MRRALLVSVVSVALAVTPAVATAATPVPDSPWGPVHVHHRGLMSTQTSQATSNTGMVVLVFRETPRSGPAQSEVTVQLSGQAWSTPIPLSGGKVARPTAIAWGAGNVSIVWQTPAGVNNWLFHQRTVSADGSLGQPEDLVTATFAYPWYQAAMNDQGELALAWVNGDNTDRVAIHHTDGTWTSTPAVPVVHPTSGGTPFIANPLRVFLTQSGEVTDVTWGTLGSSDRAIWRMEYGRDGAWHHALIGPTNGDTLGYDWVDEADFAADPAGDFSAVWSQQSPTSKQWTTLFRSWPASGPAGRAKVLSHLRCDYLDDSCADVAMSDDGAAVMTYAVNAGGGDVSVRLMRRSADGVLSAPQTISQPVWGAAYGGVQLSVNDRGDAVVSFIGGDHSQSYPEFARCPAGGACDQALPRGDDPSWLDLWVTSVGPRGNSTVTWTDSYRPRSVSSRHLAAFIGLP